MKLKTINVSGFKSFADKIKLDFDHGITAIVGPNGSGKSNIADAVSWVLGEQSVKTLRGGKMEDVIFNGTQSRKAQGVASVTLVIDNIDHSLPMEAEEVAVTRKLYRSGNSEYKINENLVRLKDINELFMDTGIGKDGYAIIGQGKVSEIVSARSKERREIFEEAAGISKFRYRKSEAEKQLLLSEDNLLRLKDILTEIESRIGPLQLQSQKAKKFLTLSDEKKNIEISVSIHNLSQLKQKSAKTEDKHLLATQQLNDAQQEADENEILFAEQQEKGKKLNIEIDNLRHDIENITEEISQNTSKTAVLNNDISHYESSVNEAILTFEKTELSKEELFKTKEKLIIEMDEKQQQLKNLLINLENTKNSILCITKRQAEVQKQTESLKLERAKIFDAIETAKVDSATRESIFSQSSQRLLQIDTAKTEIMEQLHKTEVDIDNCQKLSLKINQQLLGLKNEISGYNLKKDSKEKKLFKLTEKLTSAQNKLNEKRQRAKLLTDLENSMEGFGQSVKFIINAQRSKQLDGIIGTVSSLITTDKQYALAIETALGFSMQNIVTDTQKSAKSAIFKLKNQKAGRATFLPLDTIKFNHYDMSAVEMQEGFVGRASELITFQPQFKNIFGWLLGRIIIASDLNSATAIAKKTGYRFKIVTLDGQVVNTGGSLTGGFSRKSSGILSRKSEIEKLNYEADILEESFSEIRSQHTELQNEIKALNAEIFAIEAQNRTLTEDKIRCETQEKSLFKQREEKIKSHDNIIKETHELNDKISRIKDKGQQSNELFENLNNELSQLQLEISKCQEKQNTLLEEREKIIQCQNNENTQITILENAINIQKTEIEKTEDIFNSKERERKDINLKIETLKNQAENAKTEIKNLETEIKNKNNFLKEINRKTDEKLNERTQNELKLTQLRKKEREFLSNRDDYYKEVVRLTQQKDSLKTQIANIISSLFDQYELTLSMAEELAQPIDDIVTASRRLKDIKSRIKSMGSVNVSAIEEYDEVSSRFEELSHQIEDITQSKKELTKLIGELTEEMCDIFTDKFKKIGENFSLIFKELFGGGHAKLTLSDPNNILESGIEISVTPPGKVIKNLASLSGGEQSFVAIAIFFAILKVNPSPFCLMDEIEAALDDVNVTKFANYLHTLTKKTQFITITHRRGTMEEADVLYGVTMQEEGVSKLLKLETNNITKDFYK